MRRRATSDPSQPPLKPKSSFERALERGDEARFAKRLHVKKEDIARRDAELEAAEDEMRSRIAEIMAAGAEITRRLDYGYYNLLEKVGNLVATITSFQSLSTQTAQLIANFDKETTRLDADTRRRVEGFKAGFDVRERKALALAERGRKVGARAEDLSLRLENARLVVENWEKREDQVKKVWDRVFGIVWWTSIVIFVLVVATVLAKEWWFRGDPVKAGLGAHSEGSWNKSLRLGGDGPAETALLGGASTTTAAEGGESDGHDVGLGANVPEDVKVILRGIADRNRNGKAALPEVPRETVDGCEEAGNCMPTEVQVAPGAGLDDDPWLRRLDEL